MEEELQESDIIWSDNHYYHCSNITKNNSDTKEVFIIDESSSSFQHSQLDVKHNNKNNNNKKKKTSSSNSNSHPINIPLPGYSWSNSYDSYHFNEDEDEMIPPHLMAARRLTQNTGFSVCTGTGRTLKGRDLSQVRNSILRMTGFLET